MGTAARPRFGHSVDAFIATAEHDQPNEQNQGDTDHSTPEMGSRESKNVYIDTLELYQRKIKLKERITKLIRPRQGENLDETYEKIINAEESKQVIHGIWNMEQSDRFWNTLMKEDEVNFPLANINPATVYDYATGKCKTELNFKTTHFKALLKDSMPTRSDEVTKQGHTQDKELVLAMFGGAIPSEEQMQACNGKLSISNILDTIYDLEVSNELYVVTAYPKCGMWNPVQTKGTPSARAFHATTVIYTDIDTPFLCVTGGFGEQRSLTDMTLNVLPLQNQMEDASWIVVNVTGKLPTNRYGHVMAQVGEYLTIFGGTDGKELLNDLWVLEMNTGSFVDGSRVSSNEWKIVDIIGPVPSPRSFHSAVKIGMDPPNPLIIYGGITDDDSSRLYALGMDNHGELRWAILPITAKGPIERRAFHSMTYGNGEIVITGGEDYTSEYPTVHQCLVYHMEARELQFTEESLPFTGHRSILINRRMSHFGGLKNIASTVYLEHIAEPNAGDETLDVANTIERNYIEEIINRLREAEEDRINNTTEEPCKNSVCAMQHQIKIPEVEQPPIPVTSTRPQRQAAKICAQKIEEAAARSLANEMQRMNDNNLEPTQPTEHSTTTE